MPRSSLRRASRPLVLLALLAIVQLSLQAALADDRTAVIGARAEQRTWSDPLEALGTLRADESVTLSSTLTEIVSELNFNDGEEVEAGQLLVRLEDSEAQAQLRAAQALRDERRNTLDRSAQLQSRNLAPRADVEDNQARLRQVEAEIEAIQARLAAHRIRAPFDGVVGFRNISPGALVTPGMELLTLDKLDVVKLDFRVPEVHLAALYSGLRLTATSAAFPDAIFEGVIESVGSRIDPVSRSVSVRAELANPDQHLRPGMLMEVILQRRPRQTVVVPESVIIPSGERQHVLVIDETDEHRIARREVRIGERRAGQVEIVEGLESGELVVSHGVQRVRDGERIKLLGIASDATSIREILEQARPQPDREEEV
ncbi:MULTISPECIES: efflux RND transporter periplasmic adaptor subunit [Halomonadaceae]|uniref:efflux RND transporter periplasmic adaptor subunit n=1 Tax=Halomonadaceae TaxID=28256 RepID=UPI0015980692|nr:MULTISPECIES: efflux RND transporter periplasmic adaptor subunit [Halomonas]QJQ94947.1 efflux RND transporter periplasmic adaptor subunit [Halomonas sp. PA5]